MMTREIPQPVLAALGPVPCNGCTRCCKFDAVRILRHEDETRWLTVPHERMPGARMLAQQPNGDCVYLAEIDGKPGCSIQDTKPQQCREMDCRRLGLALTFTQARKASAVRILPFQVWARGRELLREGGQLTVLRMVKEGAK